MVRKVVPVLLLLTFPLLGSLAPLPVRAAPPPYPDLIVQRTTLTVSDTGWVSAASVIKNVGGADAGASWAIWVKAGEVTAANHSPNGSWVLDDQLVPALPAGRQTTVRWDRRWPTGNSAQFVFVADAKGSPASTQAVGGVVEAAQPGKGAADARWAASELNNALVVPFAAHAKPGNYGYDAPRPAVAVEERVSPAGLVVGSLPPLPPARRVPDLVVASCSLAAIPGDAGRVRLSVEVRNVGDALAAGSNIGTFLLGRTGLRELTVGPDAHVLPLAPGGAATRSLDLTLPSAPVQLLVYADVPTSRQEHNLALGQVYEHSGLVTNTPYLGEVNNVVVIPLDPAWVPPFMFVNPPALR